jgi:hypothetical protein
MVDVPSRVFPLPGWSGPIQNHWGVSGAVGGSDLMVTPGSQQPVVSITNGTVVFRSTQKTAPNSGGNAVEIKGTDGLYYYYAHLAADAMPAMGATVKAGQQLGIADSSGDASKTAPHLHIGIGHSISEGVGALGGTGTGFNAVALLKDLQSRANIPALATPSGQAQVNANQAAGTIKLGTPQPPVATSPMEEKIRYLAQLLSNAGVDPSKIAEMVAISLAENGSSDPNAKSSTNDYGLWQINWPTWGNDLCKNLEICSLTSLMDPANNAKAAKYVLDHQGLSAWTTFKVGAQKKFQAAVDAALSGIDLGSGTIDTSGGGYDSSNVSADCPDWTLFSGDIAGNHVEIKIPDLGCVLLTNLEQLIGGTAHTFQQFMWEKAYDWAFNIFFGLVGLIFIFIGGAAIAGDNPQAMAMAAVAA